MSNVTDADALAAEPGVAVRLTVDAAAVATADLVVVPGSKHTVGDLAWLRERRLDTALADRARAGQPIVGVCGGAQMLGRRLTDHVESGAGEVTGLGLVPLETVFAEAKHLARRTGRCPPLGDAPAAGYEIRHGRLTRHGGKPLLVGDDGSEDGCAAGGVLATSWHGLAECDPWRRALLAWVARVRGRDFQPGEASYAAHREARLERLADLVAAHCDTEALESLIHGGVPDGLPTLSSALCPPRPADPAPVSGGQP
jgi:adenosylcobyric acid synthase